MIYILWFVGSLLVAFLIRCVFNLSTTNHNTTAEVQLNTNNLLNTLNPNMSWLNDVIEWLFCNVKDKEEAHLSFIESLNYSADKVKKSCKLRFVDCKCQYPIISKISFESANQSYFDCLFEVKLSDVHIEAIINGEGCSAIADQLLAKIRASFYLQGTQLKPTVSVSAPIDAIFRIQPKQHELSVSIEEAEKTLKQVLSSFAMQALWPLPQIIFQAQNNRNLASPIKSTYTTPTMTGQNLQYKPSSKVEPKVQKPLTKEESFVDSLKEKEQFYETEDHLQMSDQQLAMVKQDGIYLQKQNELNKNHEANNMTLLQPAFQQQHAPLDSQNFEKTNFNTQNNLTTNLKTNIETDKAKSFTLKVIKANGLMESEAGNPTCCAYCLVLIDSPQQRFNTQIIKQTANPYWNEEFKAIITNLTKEIHLDVRDAGINGEDVAIGRSIVMLEEISRMPSSRQIIPLIGSNRGKTMTSGSVTVEFIFPEEFTIGNSSGQNSSPNMTGQRNKQNNKQASTDLISHNLALNAGLSRDASPSLNSSKYDLKYATLQPNYQSMPSIKEVGSPKKRESLADSLRRKFGKFRAKRSQSADRANQSLQQQMQQQQQHLQQQMQQIQQPLSSNPVINVDYVDRAGSWDELHRKGRSKSFGSNIKKFFRKSREIEPTRGASLNIKYDSANEWQPPSQTQDRPKRATTPVTFNDQVSTSDDETRPIIVIS